MRLRQKPFDDNVRRTRGCWYWTAGLTGSGYGAYYPRANHQVLAHRYAYRRAHGRIPRGKLVLHTCDNPRCVNPKHLFLGTHGDNARDRASKKRGAIGERVWTNKLTEKQVRTIRRRLRTGEAGGVLAAEFGVTDVMISRIRLRQAWKHI
jgi:hypothetical protein